MDMSAECANIVAMGLPYGTSLGFRPVTSKRKLARSRFQPYLEHGRRDSTHNMGTNYWPGNNYVSDAGVLLANALCQQGCLALELGTKLEGISQSFPLQTLHDLCTTRSIPGTNHYIPVSATEEYQRYPCHWRTCVEPVEGKTRTRDKYRVVYTEKQRRGLEQEYKNSKKFITMKRKKELSEELSLSERQV